MASEGTNRGIRSVVQLMACEHYLAVALTLMWLDFVQEPAGVLPGAHDVGRHVLEQQCNQIINVCSLDRKIWYAFLVS